MVIQVVGDVKWIRVVRVHGLSQRIALTLRPVVVKDSNIGSRLWSQCG